MLVLRRFLLLAVLCCAALPASAAAATVPGPRLAYVEWRPAPPMARLVTVAADGGKTDLAAVARLLAERGFNEVTVETGTKLNGSLVRAGVVDEIVLYCAPLLMGEAARGIFALPEFTDLGQAPRPRVVDVRAVGVDLRITARLEG